MKICLRRSQTCCGGMYLCSDNTISFAKAKLHFRCLSPASIFLQTASSNNAAPAEKTDETEIKAFFVWSMCQCLFLSTSSNVLAVFVPDRQIQQFSRGNFNSSAVNILLNNFALLQSLQYWRLKLEIFQKKTGNLRSSQSLHRIGSFSYLILELIWRPKPQRFMKSIRKYVFYKNAELAKQTNCAELCLLI